MASSELFPVSSGAGIEVVASGIDVGSIADEADVAGMVVVVT